MKLVTWDRQADINAMVAAWTAQYERHWPDHEVTARLKALPANPTAEEVNTACAFDKPMEFGEPWCHECGQPAAMRVAFGQGACDECGGTVEVCLECLRKALELGEAARG